MAYSQDYRQMILEKLNSGYSYRELAAEYGIVAAPFNYGKNALNANPTPKEPIKLMMNYCEKT